MWIAFSRPQHKRTTIYGREIECMSHCPGQASGLKGWHLAYVTSQSVQRSTGMQRVQMHAPLNVGHILVVCPNKDCVLGIFKPDPLLVKVSVCRG